jgi:hypothetical protein
MPPCFRRPTPLFPLSSLLLASLPFLLPLPSLLLLIVDCCLICSCQNKASLSMEFLGTIFGMIYRTSNCTSNTRPPSCHHRQAGRRRRRKATATLPLPMPPPHCRRRQRYALTKLPPLPPRWPPPLTPRSRQAAATAAKLAAAPALSPRFRRHRHRHPLCFNCYRRRCHCCRFRPFS